MNSSAKVWRYSLPSVKGEGWAIIFLDSIGCFTALSDWGDVGYRWPQQGWGDGDFRKFLLSCDDYYLTTKFGRGRKEYDPKRTLACVKEHILTHRRDARLTKEEARQEWDLLRTYDELDREFDFSQWYSATQLDDPGEFYCMRYVSDVTHFVAHVLPRLRDVLKAELAAETPAQTDAHGA